MDKIINVIIDEQINTLIYSALKENIGSNFNFKNNPIKEIKFTKDILHITQNFDNLPEELEELNLYHIIYSTSIDR